MTKPRQKVKPSDRTLPGGEIAIPKSRVKEIIDFHLKEPRNFRINEQRFYRAGLLTLATAFEREIQRYEKTNIVE